ncbi:MAG: hypothetical protein HQ522_22240 [Bacteroidetes bacterium]|nr:hypothetical protein [Bacteroidota bacterium]
MLLFVFLCLSFQVFATDKIGTIKNWGKIEVELKSYFFKDNEAGAVFLLRNTTDNEDKISSFLQLQVTNDEGDKAEIGFGTEGIKCDGAIPPFGVLKCVVAVVFPVSSKEATYRIGSGAEVKAVYFRIKNE